MSLSQNGMDDDSSSSEDSLEDQNLEDDLMAFDDDQAAIIRTLSNNHAYGSFRSNNLDNSNSGSYSKISPRNSQEVRLMSMGLK